MININSSQPLVSIIMPCYNQGQFIDEAIQSVLANTYKNIEIIVVNDGSTDEFTNKHLNSLNYEKTTVYVTKNQGVVIARNFAIEKANGEFILPLDSDDKISDNFIEECVKVFLTKQNVDVVYGETELFGEETGIFKIPPYSVRNELRCNCIVNTAMYRKSDWELIGGYSLRMKGGYEDWDFWLSFTERNKIFYKVDFIKYLYRIQMFSRNKKAMRRFRGRFLCWKILYNHFNLYARNHCIIKMFIGKGW